MLPDCSNHTVLQVLFTPSRVLFTIPSRTIRYRWQRVFSLRRSAQIHKVTVSRATWERIGRLIAFAYKALTSCGPTFQRVRLTISFVTSRHNLRFCQTLPATPTLQRPYPITQYGFRLFRFRSPLLTESLRFLLLGLLRCFSSPTYLQAPMYSVQGDTA